MTGNNPRTICKVKHATISGELMRQPVKKPPAQILKVLHVPFADFREQQPLKARPPLAITRPHLRKQPVTFPTATSSAVTDGCRPFRQVAKPRRRGGCQ